MSETSKFIGPVLKFIFPAASQEVLLNYHYIIRKIAHVTEYAVLGGLTCRALFISCYACFRSSWWIAAICFVVFIAILDEFNQSFNDLRTSSPYDVMLDVLGGTVAISITYLWRKYYSTPES